MWEHFFTSVSAEELPFSVSPTIHDTSNATLLNGTWNGTWNPDEKFKGSSPYGTPPYQPAAVTFKIHDYDPNTGYYGDVAVQGAFSGKITSVSLVGSKIEMTILYEAIGDQDVGFVTGVLSDNTIIGNFDEIIVSGIITWRGPLELTKVSTPNKCSASRCEYEGVFYKLSDEPVEVSIDYDNSESAWDKNDQANDYFGITDDFPIDIDRANYLNDYEAGNFYSHFLYAYDRFSLKQIDGKIDGYIQINEKTTFVQKDIRKPLILIHGWQGNDHSFILQDGIDNPGDNSYLGFNMDKNLPEEYFQEFLTFYDSGCGDSPIGSKAAIYLCQNYKVYLFHYPSFEHITYNGRMLGEAIRSTPDLWNDLGNQKITFITHSMGGLVVRSFIEEWGVGTANRTGEIDALGDEIGEFELVNVGTHGVFLTEKLITLATPHHGTPAAVQRWVDLGDATKARNTPGLLDLYWDDFDGALSYQLGKDLNEKKCPVSFMGTCQKNRWYYTFSERQDIEKFDQSHGGGIPEDSKKLYKPDKDGSYYVYYHPNPWLRELNQNVTDSHSGLYYFYGGSGIKPTKQQKDGQSGVDSFSCNSELCSYLEGTPYFDIARYTISIEANFRLNDAVVPTVSAFFDPENNWTKQNWRNNLAELIYDQNFYDFYYHEQNRSRFFYDYDKMRGGSGNRGTGGNAFKSANDYGDAWHDRDSDHLRLKDLLAAVDPDGISGYTESWAPEFNDWRLYYEPLFIRISMDLGFEGN